MLRLTNVVFIPTVRSATVLSLLALLAITICGETPLNATGRTRLETLARSRHSGTVLFLVA